MLALFREMFACDINIGKTGYDNNILKKFYKAILAPIALLSKHDPNCCLLYFPTT